MPTIVNKGTQHLVMKSFCGKDFHEKSQRTIDTKIRLHQRTCADCLSSGVKFAGTNYDHKDKRDKDKRVVVMTNGNTDYVNHKPLGFEYHKEV